MTEDECIAQARILSRVTVSGLNAANALIWVNEAQKQFAKDVHGLVKETYLALSPSFDIYTHMAINISIEGSRNNDITATDVVICAANANDQTGAQVATALQVALRAAIGLGADLTVLWSTTTWKFTIDAIDSTSITIAAPTAIIYASALDLLGLPAGETEDISVTGNIPEDCNVGIDLPDDFLAIIGKPEWDGNPLYPAPWGYFASPQSVGTPTRYGIQGKKMRISPSPISQKLLHLWYKYIPEEIEDGEDIAVDDNWNIAIVFYTGFLMATGNFELKDVAAHLYGLYRQEVIRHIQYFANNNPKYEPTYVTPPFPEVIDENS
jgi:hypothetical protein